MGATADRPRTKALPCTMRRRATRAARKVVIRVACKANMAVVEGLIVAAADGAAAPKAGGAVSVAGAAALTGNFGDSRRRPPPAPFRNGRPGLRNRH